jgi:hypothetical protein
MSTAKQRLKEMQRKQRNREALLAANPPTSGPPAAPPESRNPTLPLSPTMRDVLGSAGVTLNPSQRLISPIVSPVSSIDEKSPDYEPPSTLPLNTPKIEISHIVEILQQEVIDIRAHQDTRHDHLVQLLEVLLTGQASEKLAVAENTRNINNLTRHHDTIATTSRACMAKIDTFEKKIEDFLSEQPDCDGPSVIPHLLPIPDVPIMPTHYERSANQPFSNATQDSSVYHDRFNSLAPRVVHNTNFTISRSILPVNPATSQVKLTELTTISVFIWGEQIELEQQNFPYEVLQYGR